jgi:hypothetical protein
MNSPWHGDEWCCESVRLKLQWRPQEGRYAKDMHYLPKEVQAECMISPRLKKDGIKAKKKLRKANIKSCSTKSNLQGRWY